MIPVNPLTAAWAVLAPLAQKVPDPNDVKPGWIGFVVVVAVSAAVVFLLFSFRKQLRKVDANLPVERGGAGKDDGPRNDVARNDVGGSRQSS